MGIRMFKHGVCTLLIASVVACDRPVDPIIETNRLTQIKNARMHTPLNAPVRAAYVTYVVEKGEDPVNDPGGFFYKRTLGVRVYFFHSDPRS